MDFAYDPGIIDKVAPLIYRWMIEDADGAMGRRRHASARSHDV
jgi:hypothetical protein